MGIWRVDLRGPNGLRGEKDEWEERVRRLGNGVKSGGCGHSHTVFGNSEGGAATVPASVARKAGARGHGVPQSGQTQEWAGEVGLDEEVRRVLFIEMDVLEVAVGSIVSDLGPLRRP